jgi:phage tail-like protein
MPAAEARNFRYLNRAGTWPGFSFRGLALQADGSLCLRSRALLADVPPAEVAGLASASSPGGVTEDQAGNLYWSDPKRNRILCRTACDGSIATLPCVGGPGIDPGQFQSPRGLLIPPNRQSLFVVDAGNNRIQVFDLTSFQLVEILPAHGGGNTTPGTAPGKFNTPWSCAADAQGNIYVLDYGNQRIQKILSTGDFDGQFLAQLGAAQQLIGPVALAVTACGDAVRICVADVGASAIFFFDGDGNPERDSSGAAIKIPLDAAVQPMGMAATPDALFLGDNHSRRVLQYELTAGAGFGSVLEVAGYQGPVSALALASPDTLYVYPGEAVTPLRLSVAGAFVPLGAAWSGRIDLGYPVKWHELLAEFDELKAGAHLDVFAYASSRPNDAPAVSENPSLRTFFADPRWKKQARGSAFDVTGMYIGSSDPSTEKQRYLWVGVEFRSEGANSPALHDLRLEFNQDGYLALLPAIYATESPCGDVVPRLLALFQGFLEKVESEINGLPLLFDPALTPEAFLDWLAEWLGVAIDESWPVSKRREAIAEAFAWFGRRGTRKGLEHSILFATGIPAVVEEPIQQTEWWCLPGAADACCADCAAEAALSGEADAFSEDSVLGWSTALAPSAPDGAVLGRTAVLDQATLIQDDEFGMPLFSDVAHQFSVLVPRSALMCPSASTQLRAVIESEMPAHTTYQLCVLDPLMRVGYQARVGIDSIVAGPPPSMRLGEGSSLGAVTALGGPPPALVEQDTRIGITARVS